MNSLVKAVSKLIPLRNVSSPLRSVISTNGFTVNNLSRNLWHMCSMHSEDKSHAISKATSNAINWSNSQHIHTKGGQNEILKFLCQQYEFPAEVGNKHRAHFKKEVYIGERELAEFLAKEIVTERKAQKSRYIPTELEGFKVELDGSDVKLTKKSADETVEIHFSVNNSLDADESDLETTQPDAEADNRMLMSRPTFDVDIKRGNRTLSFTCCFMDSQSDGRSETGYEDIFYISEVTIFDGEWTENAYVVSANVLDSYLYDLLMNVLDEKGITDEFAEKLSELSTAYEHNLYIGLLEGLQKFADGK